MKVMHKKLWIASQLGIKRTKLVEIYAKGAFLICYVKFLFVSKIQKF